MEDEVLVLTDDLEAILGTLNASYYKSVGEDLIDTYRQLNSRPQSSPLTKDLERTLDKVKAYIESAKKEDEDEPVQ